MKLLDKIVLFTSMSPSIVFAADEAKNALETFGANVSGISTTAYVVGGVAFGILAFIMAIRFIKGMVYS